MALAAVVCGGLGAWGNVIVGGVLGGLGLVLTAWAVWFFRDPERAAPGEAVGAGSGVVVSPADGRVIKIDEAELPAEVRAGEGGMGGVGEAWSRGPYVRVAIFLNLFDVHVNRTPCAGRIVKMAYVPGKFFNASLDKASEHNERSAAVMVDSRGRHVGFVQIAGLIAWRIVNHLRVGQEVAAGERFGLIRFGSRAEVYVPRGTEVAVRVGDRVRAGETVLARMGAAPGEGASR